MKWLATLLLIPSITWSSVGTITDQAGPAAEIQRQTASLEANKGTGVEMNDEISTNKTRLSITFEDRTQVQLTEQSRLIIDDFVYDPSQGTGRMAMNVAMGTVRMASGATARNSRENVRINTPTATISVRGTDFTMTVDEIGRSLIILLPTCPDPTNPDDCWTGSIEVATDAGYVLMNQAYQATMALSASRMPTDPEIIEIEESLIDNMLIVSPPASLVASMATMDNGWFNNGLSQDLLEYRSLAENYLDDDLLRTSALDINHLTVEFLDNLLELGKFLDFSALDRYELDEDTVLPTVYRYPWIQSAYNSEQIYLYSERAPHVADVEVLSDTEGTVNVTQDNISAKIQLNSGGTNVVINIIQNQ